MTQVFREDGTVVPVTRVKAGPCVVTQLKSNAVQIGFGVQKRFRLRKPEAGHLKDIKVSNDNNLTVRFLRDVNTKDGEKLNSGDVFTVKIFTPGEKIQVVGISKGKGYQGVVKRHGFHGSKATHGNKDQSRKSGSIGATDPARVFKGTRMAGHMGDRRVTVKNLEIVEINPEENELLIKGALPGARGGLLLISTNDGEMSIENVEEPKIEETLVEDKAEEVVEKKVEEKTKVDAQEERDSLTSSVDSEVAQDKEVK